MSDVLKFWKCPGESCICHFVGFHNFSGICYCGLTGTWLASDNFILMELEVLEKMEDGNNNSLSKLVETIKLLKLELKTKSPMVLTDLLNLLCLDPFHGQGDHPAVPLANAIEQLAEFGVGQALDAISRPCSCGQYDEAELYLLDVQFHPRFEDSLHNRFIAEPPLNEYCFYCKKVTSRRKLLAVRQWPRFLAVKYTENAHVTVPIIWKVPDDYSFDEESKIQNKGLEYHYRGHAVKVIIELTDVQRNKNEERRKRGEKEEKPEEHSICVVHWGEYLHKIDNRDHEICKTPTEPFTIKDLDVILYEVQPQRHLALAGLIPLPSVSSKADPLISEVKFEMSSACPENPSKTGSSNCL